MSLDTTNKYNNPHLFPTQPTVLDGVSLSICDQDLVAESASMATMPPLMMNPRDDHKEDDGREEHCILLTSQELFENLQNKTTKPQRLLWEHRYTRPYQQSVTARSLREWPIWGYVVDEEEEGCPDWRGQPAAGRAEPFPNSFLLWRFFTFTEHKPSSNSAHPNL